GFELTDSRPRAQSAIAACQDRTRSSSRRGPLDGPQSSPPSTHERAAPVLPAGFLWRRDRIAMTHIRTKDGTHIFYKDWGPKNAQPIVFHHGWPLSADDWDNQMMFFLGKGFRVIAHDRRGHGRSTQTDGGNDMDTYAADVDALVTELGLTNAIHIGHSTGGGEVTRYVARHGKGRVAKAILVDAVPPVMVKSDKNPRGLPIDVFDQIREGTAKRRSQFYQDLTLPFYVFSRPGATSSQGVRANWWRQ